MVKQKISSLGRFRVRKSNESLHIVGQQSDGKCDLCHKKETVVHFFMECQTPFEKTTKEKCDQFNIDQEIENILIVMYS